MEATLLIELLTEELPPKSLARLGQSFSEALAADLRRDDFLAAQSVVRLFATPRRLAVSITRVRDVAPDSVVEKKGPAVKSALDASGNPTPALSGFARSRGVTVEQLIRISDGKQEVFAYRETVKGSPLETSLDLKLTEALKKLPVAKMMRWGSGDAQFVRPVHGLVMMHGTRVVPGEVLDLQSGNRTRGHRFLGASEIVLADADSYERRLTEDGHVIADFAKRRTAIELLLTEEAKRIGASLGEAAELLDEVTALVEQPAVYVGAFDPAFLQVPQECLILTMQRNQKYFPLFGAEGRLLPKFLIVSNMPIPDPRHIIAGNERVVRPRLEDARFFYEQDRKARLETRVPELARVVYHNKLGSQLERTQRVQLLAGSIARRLGADAAAAERAAWLAKADLLTGMVGEFPELQGTMGRYYARHDGEPAEVADAIEAHYRPRFAGDALPEGKVACAVALADKLVTLAGLFGIGQQPTGDKDPFGLRRAALGVLRILVERAYPLSLHDLVNEAYAVFPKGLLGQTHTDLSIFAFERFAGYLKERGYSTLEIDAVLCMNPVRLDLVPQQLDAVRAFLALPEAASLAAANKRVANILRQAEAKGESYGEVEIKTLRDPAETALAQALQAATATAHTLFARGDYTGYLKTFAVLKAPVDRFFDDVMVMVDDASLRRNRLALLAALRTAMNRVADISRLAQ